MAFLVRIRPPKRFISDERSGEGPAGWRARSTDKKQCGLLLISPAIAGHACDEKLIYAIEVPLLDCLCHYYIRIGKIN